MLYELSLPIKETASTIHEKISPDKNPPSAPSEFFLDTIPHDILPRNKEIMDAAKEKLFG